MGDLLAIDAGTTGVTAILFDEALRPRARAYREFAQSFPRPGWVEHEASAITEAVDATLAELLAAPAEVAAVGIANQRETVFALDLATGRALGPGIVWQDRRTAERCRELEQAGHGELVRARTGLRLDPYFSATKIEWLLDSVVDKIHGGPGQGVTGATIRNAVTGETQLVPCGGIFMAIGHTPNTAVFEGQLERDDQGYLLVHDGTTATSVPRIMIGIGRNREKMPSRIDKRRWSTAMFSIKRMLSVIGRMMNVEMNSMKKMRMLTGT